MRRNGYIVLLVAVVAWVVVAVVLGAGSPGAHTVVPPSGPSPACLPTTLDRSATLAGTHVQVSPAPASASAGPSTQISFLGTPVTDIQDVSVEGSSSGYHHGHLYGYYQGDGASFVPEKPFTAGERVVVHALLGGPGAERASAFSFRIATPYPTGGIPSFPDPPAAPSAIQSFASAPELSPPILDVSAPDLDPAAGDVMMTSGPGPGQYGPLIYSPQGRLIWFDPQPKGQTALGLTVQRYEGQNDLTWWQGHVLDLGFGQGEDVVVDANYQTVATVRAGNGLEADLHEFQLAPDNVAYLTAYSLIRCDLSSVGGVRNGSLVDSAIQAIDMKTGLVRWEWHSLDHVGVGESHTPVPSTAAVPWDYFHLNSIDLEPDGDVLISARSTWAAYLLHGGAGTIAWRLGGSRSSFAMGPGTQTAWQHDARLLPDGTITFYDDGSNPAIHYQSRGVRIAIDTTRHTARLVREYAHPGSALLADSQGNMQMLPDQNVVVGWGSIPSVSELSKDGKLLLDAHAPAGYSSYRAFRFPWVGHPLTQPSASARELVSGDATSVFASWNGATEVASWRVLAGASPGSLSERASMPDSGFESSVTFPDVAAPGDPPIGAGGPIYVAVQALAADGRVLATSATVRVSGT